MGRTKEKIKLIKKLDGYHPAEVEKCNDKFAHYTGGMRDSGDLNWRYLLFEATKFEILLVLKMLEKRGSSFTQINYNDRP